MQVGCGKARCKALPKGSLVSGQLQAGSQRRAALAQKKKVAQVSGQFAHEKAYIHALLQNLAAKLGHGGAVLRMQGFEKFGKHLLPGQAQHLSRGGGRELFAAQGQRLIQQRHAVAHAARRAAGQQAHGAVFKRDVFFAQHAGKVLDQRVFAQMAEDKMLAAAHDGNGELVRLGGGKDKNHARWRLFKGF